MKNETLLNYDNEIKRKKFHILSFIIPLYYMIFPDSIILFMSLLLVFILSIDFYRIRYNKVINLPIIKNIKNTIRPYEKNGLMSATLLTITSFIIILFFKKNIAIISISIAAICDTAAAIFGMKYGKTKLLLNKTLEGSFAFLITGCILIFLLNNILNLKLDIIFLIACIAVAAFIESITPTKYDNISVPISSAIILHIFYII
tara:strand:+ start:2048 stop:2656 length:609 start_codon:yes stop_codon:yes gene_type:complete